MTDNNLDDILFDTFDRTGPSNAAEARMLEAVLAECERTTAPPQKQKPATWKKALPLAACLVLALGLGTFALWQTNLNANLSGGASSTASSAPQSGATTSSAAPSSSDRDVRYPFITLSSGEQLRVALADDGPVLADPSIIGEEFEETLATNDVEPDALPCTVFTTTNAEHPYAVRYAGDDAFYLADKVA